MAICTVSDVHDLAYADRFALQWLLALITAGLVWALGRRKGANGWIAAGIGVMSVPAWYAILYTAPDIVRTFCAQGDLNQVIVPGQTVPALARDQLSGQYIGAILRNLGHVAVGALLVWRGRDPQWRTPRLRAIAKSLSGMLPMGGGEARSLGLGVALFPVLLAANVLLAGLVRKTGDDSQVFANIEPLQVLLLALAAGVGEELVYRGVLQQGLAHLVRNRLGGIAVGLAVQSMVFAYAHTGYKDLQHLQFAFYFAIVAGVVAQWLGIWAAIALHVLIDLAAFVSSIPSPPAWLVTTASGVLVAVLGVSVYLVVLGLRWLRRRRTP